MLTKHEIEDVKREIAKLEKVTSPYATEMLGYYRTLLKLAK